MIQYQYFHTGKEFIPKLSLNPSDEKYSDNEKFFETIRTNIRGDAFTYALLSDEFFMLQATTKRESGLFVKGLRGETSLIANFPARYVDRFEKSASDSDKNSTILPDGRLPALDRLSESFAIAERLHHIFAKLFDAIVYDNNGKQIIIVTESHEKALNYLKVISMLLPISYIRKIGFSIGCTNIPDEPLSIVNDRGEVKELTVRLWLPEFSSFNFDSYADKYYVFDTVSHRDNYNKELSNVAKVINEINLCDVSQSRNFINYMAKAFDSSGNVSLEELDKLSAIYLFNFKRDADSARNILELGSEGGVEQEQAVINAIQYLLSETHHGGQLPPQDRFKIESEYRSNTHVAHAVSDSLYEYCVSFYRYLDESEKQIFLQLISNDNTGARLDSFLQSSLRGDFHAMVEAFSVMGKALEMQMNSKGASVVANRGIIKTATSFFDIINCHQRIPMEQRFNGEDFFITITGFSRQDIQILLCAILMASAYYIDVPVECCEIRIKGMKRFLQGLQMPSLKQLEFILGVRSRILEIADGIQELNIDEDFDLIFNCEAGRSWMRELLNSFSVQETLQADFFVRSHSAERRFYESMQTFLRERLLNIGFIKKYIKKGIAERNRYIEFFNSLPKELRDENGEIADLIEDVNHEIELDEEFAQYRYNFAKECYSTFQEVDKKKVKKDLSVLSYKETPANERLEIVEKTINTFGTVTKMKRKKVRFFSSIGIWAFFLGLLSLVILSVPAIVIPASLGTFDLSHICNRLFLYFLPEFVAIPFGTYLLDYLIYLCLRQGNRVKRANIITLICGILPVLLFVIAYIVFYFIRLPLPFMTE